MSLSLDRFNRGTLGFKLALTFGAMIAISCVSTLLTIWSTGEVLDLQEEVNTDLHPSALSGVGLRGAISASASELQAYLVLGTKEPLEARKAHWEGIYKELASLQGHAEGWQEPAKQELKDLSVALQKLEEVQDKVERIAHTPAAQPALEVMINEAAPIAAKILSSLTTLIEEEKRLPADRVRKRLLGEMADTRAFFAVGTSNIRAFLLSGDDKWKQGFDENWKIFDITEKKLQESRYLMSPSQAKILDRVHQLRMEFHPLQEKMFRIRTSADWNLPISLQRDEVRPLHLKVLQLTSSIVEYQSLEADRDSEHLTSLAGSLRWKVALMFLLGLVVGVRLAMQFTRSLTRRVGVLLEAMARASEGDLATEVEVEGDDEISQIGLQLATLLNATRESTSELIKQVTKVASSAHRLTNVASEMQSETTGMHEQSGEVSSTVEQLGINISTVAAASEESTTALSTVAGNVERMSSAFEAVNGQVQFLSENFDTVVEAVDEMKDSLGGVAKNTEEAATISKEAAQMARSSDVIVTALGQSASEIAEVIGVISEIADQTNLLALNASIEAATAGDAGKGFAVVASEVKALAKQTANATLEIEDKIGNIKSSTAGTVEAIRNIVEVIERIDGFSQSTARALRDQQITAAQIAESMTDAAKTASTITTYVSESSQEASGAALSFEALTDGAADIAQNASQLAIGATGVSSSIGSMASSISTTSSGADRVNDASKELAEMAKVMSELVSRFKV
ncbi:MAG: methyl-accepting chemotaxis protein [Deltaproteobacteria bacterium]|nr:methyl-accepting chemotaxis protein [Deltaproteobacteria bacterium]